MFSLPQNEPLCPLAATSHPPLPQTLLGKAGGITVLQTGKVRLKVVSNWLAC